MPLDFIPARSISDQGAADFVRGRSEFSVLGDDNALAYAPSAPGLDALADAEAAPGAAVVGVAENITVVPKSVVGTENGPGRTERFLTVREVGPWATRSPATALLAPRSPWSSRPWPTSCRPAACPPASACASSMAR